MIITKNGQPWWEHYQWGYYILKVPPIYRGSHTRSKNVAYSVIIRSLIAVGWSRFLTKIAPLTISLRKSKVFWKLRLVWNTFPIIWISSKRRWERRSVNTSIKDFYTDPVVWFVSPVNNFLPQKHRILPPIHRVHFSTSSAPCALWYGRHSCKQSPHRKAFFPALTGHHPAQNPDIFLTRDTSRPNAELRCVRREFIRYPTEIMASKL